MPFGVVNNLVKMSKDQLDRSFGEIKYLKDVLGTFKVDKAVERRDLAKAIGALSLLDEEFGEVNTYEDIQFLSKRFSSLINLD